METKRTHLDINAEFHQDFMVVSCVGDLMSVAEPDSDLVDVKLWHIGSTCYRQSDEMSSLFNELLDLYTGLRKQVKTLKAAAGEKS